MFDSAKEWEICLRLNLSANVYRFDRSGVVYFLKTYIENDSVTPIRLIPGICSKENERVEIDTLFSTTSKNPATEKRKRSQSVILCQCSTAQTSSPVERSADAAPYAGLPRARRGTGLSSTTRGGRRADQLNGNWGSAKGAGAGVGKMTAYEGGITISEPRVFPAIASFVVSLLRHMNHVSTSFKAKSSSCVHFVIPWLGITRSETNLFSTATSASTTFCSENLARRPPIEGSLLIST